MGFFSSVKDSVANSFGSLLGAGIEAGASVFGAIQSSKNYEKTNDANMQMNAQNIAYQREANEKNIALQREINEKNINYQREENATNRAWQKSENDLARSREDNAYQRAVADAIQAGLSPLVVNNGASAQAMQAATGSAPRAEAGRGYDAPKNAFRQNPDTITSALIANGVKNAVDAFNSSEERRVKNKLASAEADKTVAETQSINIANAHKAEEISAKIEQIRADIKLINEKSEHEKLLTEKQRQELDTWADKLKNDLQIQVATLNEIKANTVNTYDVVESRAIDDQIKEHNLEYAKASGAPVGFVPSNPTQVGAMAGVSLAKQKAFEEAREAEKKQMIKDNMAVYESDLEYYNIEKKRAQKYFAEIGDYKGFIKWQEEHPSPKRKDYRLKRK